MKKEHWDYINKEIALFCEKFGKHTIMIEQAEEATRVTIEAIDFPNKRVITIKESRRQHGYRNSDKK